MILLENGFAFTRIYVFSIYIRRCMYSSDSCAVFSWLVMGSWEHPLSTLSIEGLVRVDGESYKETIRKNANAIDGSNGGPGGGSGGTILLFLRALAVSKSAILSSAGGHGGPNGSGGGGGGRIHFHWSDIPIGDVYQPIASVNGSIHAGSVYSLN